MASVTGFTAGRMLAMENATIINGAISGDNLMLITKGGTNIDAGNVRGPVGPPGFPNPVGTIIFGGWLVDPDGYWILDGRTITNGQNLYPGLAAQYPAWLSEQGHIILPVVTDTVPMGGTSSLGLVNGSMTHVLSSGQLPSHNHTNVHQHTLNGHNHGGTVTPVLSHDHTAPSVSGATQSYALHSSGWLAGDRFFTVWSGGIPNSDAAHVQMGFFNEATGGASVVPDGGHGHTVSDSGTLTTNQNTGGVTGSVGSGSSINHTPKNLRLKMAVKY